MKRQETKPVISVIVPAYNTRKYLSRCLDTLMAQTISEMEIIVIDDCSDENIYELIAPYLDQGGKSIYYERLDQHRGPGGARNRGIALASGKYIAFCDSDDWVDLTYYEDCVRAMDRSGASIGMCSLVREYDYQQKVPLYKCKYDREISLTGDLAIKALTKQLNIGVQIIPPAINKIYCKDYLDQINLRFVEERLFEDLIFSFISFMHAPKLICIPHAVYHHYKRPSSIVQSFDQKHTEDLVEIFTLLRNYLKSVERYETYQFHYYKFLEQFYNLIVREIFEFVADEETRKVHLSHSLQLIRTVIDFDEYMEYTSAEQLRQHIQPHIVDTTIY